VSRILRRVLLGALASSAVIASVVFTSCGRNSALPLNTPIQNVGAWQVGVANEPDPAHVGDNTITVVVRDSSGRSMPGTVDLVVGMQAMGSMPSMESRGKVKSRGRGVFSATYGLAMGGEWDVTVRLHPTEGPPAEARYRLSTSIRGLAFAGGTPPVGSGATTPVTMALADSNAEGVTIDVARRQSLGIRTEKVQVRELATTLRVPGRVVYDEAHQAEISLKFSGWVRTLSASVTGQPVGRGQVLFAVYSPELWSAQQEYLEALRAAQADRGKPDVAASSEDLVQAAHQRLLLWDLSPVDIDQIASAGHPLEAVPIRSPASGVITEKAVVQGSPFQAGQVLFRIAQLDPIWVIANVPQQNAAFVRPRMAASISDPYGATRTRKGVVSFIYPSLDSTTRTVEVRVETRNPDGRLQPGTFVNVELATSSRTSLAVPESAVLPTGERYVVFVDLGDGRLMQREVQLGSKAGGYYEVLSGLRAGETVVTSGNFLVAAESKLRTGAQER